jgi:hypothetical protein
MTGRQPIHSEQAPESVKVVVFVGTELLKSMSCTTARFTGSPVLAFTTDPETDTCDACAKTVVANTKEKTSLIRAQF